MPDGTHGKGFVNPITWSFIGNLPYDKLTNEQLVMAYSGWVWLFSALQNETAESDFAPSTADALMQKLESEGLRDFSITGKYRVGDSEFFEFSAQRAGTKVKAVWLNRVLVDTRRGRRAGVAAGGLHLLGNGDAWRALGISGRGYPLRCKTKLSRRSC